MEKTIFEQMGSTYEQKGDYLIPYLPTKEEKPIRVWGQRHLRYIKQHRKIFYTNLLTSGTLYSYLADINELSNSIYENMIPIYQSLYQVTEELKKSNLFEWVRKNIIINAVSEIIYNDVIFR